MTSAHQTQLPLDAAAASSRPTTGHSVDRHRGAMLLTVRDVEAELQLGRTRTYELLRSGEIPVIRIGRVLRVPRDALHRWIDTKCQTSPTRWDAALSRHQEPDHRLSRADDP